jgi:ABC-type Mn2+/Zn2+ transport system permease subunit
VLVAPAATARTLTHRLGPMIGLAAAIGVAGGVAGLYLSYYARTAGGASVAVVLVCAYLATRALARA